MPNIWSRLQCRREGTVTCDVLSLWLLGQFVVGWAVILLWVNLLSVGLSFYFIFSIQQLIF
jgi:hypothetical protein